MYPLIEITSVPIEIQMKTKNASLEYTRGTAEMEITRAESGGVDIKSRPIRLNWDTFQPSGAPPAPQMSGASRVYEATSGYLDQGQIKLNARVGDVPASQEAQQDAPQMQQSAPALPIQPPPQPIPQPQSESEAETLDMAPVSGLSFEWEDGQMEILYDMEKLKMDWKIEAGEFKFTPGDIEISVEQRPSVIIKYLGGPIYVPASADPNYEPVDVKA